MATILVLHGPNMALKGVAGIDEALDTRASELGVELRTASGNHDGALVDELLRVHLEVDAIIVNAGVVAPQAWALAEALTLLKKPALEVQFTPLDVGRGPSALTAAVRGVVSGAQAYVAALEQLVKELGIKPAPPEEQPVRRSASAKPGRAEKSIGRKVAAAAPEEAPRGGKTIGRGPEKSTTNPATTGLTRALVREKLKARLSGGLSADALAAWARGEWSKLNAGGACEESARTLLDGVLLTVMSAARATDALVLAQLARLDQG